MKKFTVERLSSHLHGRFQTCLASKASWPRWSRSIYGRSETTCFTPAAEEPCKKIQLSVEQRTDAIRTVDQLFSEFHSWSDEMIGRMDRYGTDTSRGISDIIARSWKSSTAQVERYDAALAG